MSRLLGPLLLKNRRFWGWFVPKNSNDYIFCFLGHLFGGQLFELFARETNLKKQSSLIRWKDNEPRSKKMLPPAIVGDLKGLAKSASLCSSDLGIGSHLKFRPQLKPPRTKGLGEYWNVSALIMSIIGVTTRVLSPLILDNSGSSQLTFA